MLRRQQVWVATEPNVTKPHSDVVRRPIRDGNVRANVAIRLWILQQLRADFSQQNSQHK